MSPKEKELTEALSQVNDLAHKMANGAAKFTGGERISSHKEAWRNVRDFTAQFTEKKGG